MSVAKLLLSGLLVSSGLILGAFTLHGHFASQWEVQATVPSDSQGEPQVAALLEPGSVAASDTVSDNWTPKLVRADDPPTAAEVEARKARKRLLEKKLAEKRQAQKKDQAKPEEPQTLFPWLLSLFQAANSDSTTGNK
jgi:hypothetical protein